MDDNFTTVKAASSARSCMRVRRAARWPPCPNGDPMTRGWQGRHQVWGSFWRLWGNFALGHHFQMAVHFRTALKFFLTWSQSSNKVVTKLIFYRSPGLLSAPLSFGCDHPFPRRSREFARLTAVPGPGLGRSSTILCAIDLHGRTKLKQSWIKV